jgi:uncharacterized protein YdaU (DUF1376 family)
MSRAFIAFYPGDYLKKTMHLNVLEHGAYFLLLCECWTNGKIPIEPMRRAAICKLSLKEWNKIAPTINPFFQEDGTNQRASEEIEKSEVTRLRRQVAGHKGGTASVISRARSLKQTLSNAQARHQANVEQTSSPAQAIKNSITTTFSEAAREVFDEQDRLEKKKVALQASPELLSILSGKTRR